MVEIDLSPDDQCRAIALADHKVYDRSMRGKDANLVGAYGEIIVYDYLKALGLEPEFVHLTTHDIECAGFTIDVKTKERTVKPEPHYDCTLPAYNHDHQRPDFFIFVSLLAHQKTGNRRFRKAWILGKMCYSRVSKTARLWKKGEVDPRNGWAARMDCYNVEIADLMEMKQPINL